MLPTDSLLHHLPALRRFEVSPRLISWINMLFVLLLAYALAGISWQLWPLQTGSRAALLPVVSPSHSGSATSGAVSLGGVAAMHLFGVAAPEAMPVPSVVDAPETRLSLTLRGIVALSEGGEGRALIAAGSATEKVYKVGDLVSGGAILHEVLSDKVILKRGSRFETLTLPRERAKLSVPPSSSREKVNSGSRGITPGPRGAVMHQLSTLRDRIAEEPQQAFDLVQVQPVMEAGMIKGYRVNPGKQRRLFHGTGLRAGDVVTSVNGIALSDPAQMATLFAQFKSASRFNLEVERGGRPTSLTIDLGR
jgi:general secretion pathway protein C